MKSIEYKSQVQPLSREELNTIGGGGNEYVGFYFFGKFVRAIVGALENTPKLPSATQYK